MPASGHDRNASGRRGEILAAAFLTRKGWCILHRNLRFGGFGEIDLLAQDGNEIVIVEVKVLTKPAQDYDPADRLNFQKRQKLAQLAQIIAEQYPDRDVRVDGVTIAGLETVRPLINHYENITF